MNTLKENYEKEVEALKEAHKAEIDQVQAAINEVEIKKIKEETEVNTFLVTFFIEVIKWIPSSQTIIRTQYESQLNETKTQHDMHIQTLNEEQQRIKKEMEKLDAEHQEEKNRLKNEYETLIEESKEKEKVKKKKKNYIKLFH